ncbi:shikimate dehydrogenase [Ornithinicoccus hortensis]|uniref:Shikimate dehydrogenase n=1 Tax=Ornithinicoccus hortensis TaxID=82346 RepID=A0A542YSJ1_9MICO|nr:shikimate dehydrogenase [Ornithinicoccus hortensis]TQL51021.1 shikimate dehydrogenase [Ornithinicoccus hortensis]
MPHRAGVVGDPIAHSLSPALHTAAYAALGLTDWTYGLTRVPAGDLARHVGGLDDSWVGISVTMPGKEEALALADVVGDEAALVGASNTLTRTEGGWRADNTDVAGLAEALTGVEVRGPGPVDVIGAGATARSALVALHRVGARSLRFVVRGTVRPETAALAVRLGLTTSTVSYADWSAGLARGAGADVDLVLSTVPPGATPPVDGAPTSPAGVVFDVTYAPWPSPLAHDVARHGRTAVGGWTMLLHQAAAQVRLMTGLDAPVEAMRAALAERLPQAAAG